MAAVQEAGTPAPAPTEPAAKQAPKPLVDRMRDAGWTPENDTSPAAGETPKAPAIGKKPSSSKAPKQAEPKHDDAIEKLAAERGLVVDGGRLTTKERAEHRVLIQQQRDQLARAEQDAIARVNHAHANLEERFKKVEAFETAIKNRDHEALAKAGGFESWEKLQGEIIAFNSDPNYASVRELREWKEAQQREAEQQAQQRQAHHEAQQRVHAENTYLGNLSGGLKASQDPLCRVMADDPLFLRAVYRIQQENWDGREPLAPEQAVRMSARGFKATLGEELRALYGRLHQAFGEQSNTAASTPRPKSPGGLRTTRSVAGRQAGRTERIQHMEARLTEAVARDRKSGTDRY